MFKEKAIHFLPRPAEQDFSRWVRGDEYHWTHWTFSRLTRIESSHGRRTPHPNARKGFCATAQIVG
jgi:hypothetical protein